MEDAAAAAPPSPPRTIKLERPLPAHLFDDNSAISSSSSFEPTSHPSLLSPNHPFNLSQVHQSASRTLPQHHPLHHLQAHHQQLLHAHHPHSPTSAPAFPSPSPPPPPPQYNHFDLPAAPRYLIPESGEYPNMASPNVPQHSVQVIDLTGSSPPSAGPSRQPVAPPPRSSRPGREVIDVDALPDSPHERHLSLDVEDDIDSFFLREGSSFLRPEPSRPRRRFQGRASPPPPRPIEPLAFPGFIPGPRFYQDDGGEDPILGHGGRIGQQGADMGPNPTFYNRRQDHRANMMQAMAHRNLQPPRAHGFRPPNELDYVAQASGILRPNAPPIDAAAIRNADYKTPPPPQEGFTSSPRAADVLVCALCDQELGVETDSPQAGQVWAGKCGHCYCGNCAMEFRAPVAPGAKRVRNDRKRCVVADCTSNLSAKAGLFKIHV